MLLELSIKNFAIIDDLKINFTKGLNVLTGETGSGKSIIIEALGIVLGGRGSKDVIRHGEKRAILQAIFALEDVSIIKSLFDEYGINIDKDDLIIISREISIDSPSISRINDKVVTLSILNKISHSLIDIFAQHEHQSLLNTNNHKIIIDSFGDANHRNLKNKIKDIFQIYNNDKKILDEMNLDIMERERMIDLYRFQIDEIDCARLSDYDDEQIEDDYKKLSNIMEITQGVGEIIDSFKSEKYEKISLLDYINRNITILNNLSKLDNSLNPYLGRLMEVNYELQDLNNEFIHYMDNTQLDEEKLKELGDRLDIVNKLKKKYGNSVSKIIEFKSGVSNSLDKLINYENEIKILSKKIKDFEDELFNLSKELSESRKNIAQILEKSITKELNELNMENIKFKVSFEKSKVLTIDGIDNIEFLISTNIGEDLKPMSKIASGGEMSRIMLGFKSILAQYDGIPTLIFDEIDTGISGRTAQVVGEKILKIARDRQIISISHLPQIAAIADSQYSIYKEICDGKVSTYIHKLNDEERIFELAKLLGGVDLTETTINHAREMREMTKKLKKG